MFRRLFVLSAVLFMSGCMATNDYVAPTKSSLLDAPPGKALVYLLRSPGDELPLQVFVDGVLAVTLPAERHTALSIDPGTHVLTSRSHSARPQDQLPPMHLSVQVGQRYFMALPPPEFKSESRLAGVFMAGKAPVLMMKNSATERDTARAWIEVTEDESHWFLFYSKPALPEAWAL